MIRALALGLMIRALTLLPQPPRQPMWTCPTCQTQNEPFRTTCRNQSLHGTS